MPEKSRGIDAEQIANREQGNDIERILDFSPRELVSYLAGLQERGELASFLARALENDAVAAQVSYWEKWLDKETRSIVDGIIQEKKELYPGDTEGADKINKQLSDLFVEQRKHLGPNFFEKAKTSLRDFAFTREKSYTGGKLVFEIQRNSNGDTTLTRSIRDGASKLYRIAVKIQPIEEIDKYYDGRNFVEAQEILKDFGDMEVELSVE